MKREREAERTLDERRERELRRRSHTFRCTCDVCCLLRRLDHRTLEYGRLLAALVGVALVAVVIMSFMAYNRAPAATLGELRGSCLEEEPFTAGSAFCRSAEDGLVLDAYDVARACDDPACELHDQPREEGG